MRRITRGDFGLIVINRISPLYSCLLFGRSSGLRQDGTEWVEAELTGDEKVEGTITCISVSGRPGHTSLEVSVSLFRLRF